MSLGAPLGLLGLVALAAVVAIHLFRRRFHPRRSAGLFLYAAALPAPAAGRRRAPLRRRASLLFELIAALALTWALTEPHLADRERARHLVVVLDDRARLQAVRADGQTAADALRAALDAQLAALDRDDRVTLVTSGRVARVLVGPEATPEGARRALAAWDPRAPDHGLDDALGLALDLAGLRDRATPAGHGAVLVASDRVPDGLPEGVGVVARGEARPSSGLADARWLPADGSRPERVTARVIAHGPHGARSTRRELALRDGDRVVARVWLDLPPGEAVGAVLPLGAGAPDALELALLGPDPLTLDDAATLLRPPAREVVVAVAVPADDARPWLRALDAVTGARLVGGPSDGAHLVVIGPGAAPPPGAWTVRVVPGEGPAVLGPFLAARGHALLAGVDLTGAVWRGGAVAADVTGAPLLLAGETVLVSAAGPGDVTLHLDLARSPLVDHPAWPALVANLVAARRDALPGPTRTNVPLGQSVSVTLPPGATGLAVTDPTGARVERAADRRGQVLVSSLERVGVHELEPLGVARAAADRPWGRINGILVDPWLGDLTDAAVVNRAPADGGGAEVGRRPGIGERLLPLLLALLALVLGWRAFTREEGTAVPGARG